MANTYAAAALLGVVAASCSPRPQSAQNQNVIVARPGNGVVSGGLLTPSRREFTFSHCGDIEELPSLFQRIELSGDTAVLFIRERVFYDNPGILDTTALDRRTLAPMWSHTHYPHDALDSSDFHDLRLAWASRQPEGHRESGDFTLREQGFLGGTTDLLLEATSGLYHPDAQILFSLVDLNRPQDAPPSLRLYTGRARVTGREVVKLPKGRSFDSWVVTVDQAPDSGMYWVDKRTHEIIMWTVPDDPRCPSKVFRTSP